MAGITTNFSEQKTSQRFLKPVIRMDVVLLESSVVSSHTFSISISIETGFDGVQRNHGGEHDPALQNLQLFLFMYPISRR